MILTERHIQILKDINMFSRIKRYHGMLPVKDAAIYDEDVLQYLLDEGLVEEGVVFTTCGSNPKGYRIADEARARLREKGVDFVNNDWEKVKGNDFITLDQLEKEHVELLVDIYHFSKISKYCGIAPRSVLADYDKNVLKYLYDAGYIFHIKVKGVDVKHAKGYVLSEKAIRILRQLDYKK